jgi:MFS family permease
MSNKVYRATTPVIPLSLSLLLWKNGSASGKIDKMTKYNDLRGRALLFLLCLWFLWFISFSLRILFSPILPLLEDEYLVSHAQASGVFVFLSIGYGTSVMIAGLFSGTFGYKKTILFSFMLMGLICLLIPFLSHFWLLYAFASVLGFLVGFYIPAAIPLITELYAERNWGKVIAIHDTGASMAVFATPFIALFLLRFVSSWRGIFVVYGLIFLAAALVFSFACREVKLSSPPQTVFRGLMKKPSL